jgi:hypothetical protein
MKPVLTAAIAALILAAHPAQSVAQRVSGTVLTNDSGSPVAGAIVSAFVGRDTVATVLARADGQFNLTLPARRNLTLLVRAIGMRPVQLPLQLSADTVVSVRMARINYTLQTVNVTGITQCERKETGTADIVDVWIEVTKALESTRIARDSARRRFHYVIYETLTDNTTGKVTLLRKDSSSWVAARPFKVATPRELARDGYIVEQLRNLTNRLKPVLWYRAPDEMVLTDPSFQSSHCFWASHGEGENQNMIGVHFLPVTGIKINDIRGVFWIDAQSYELRRLDYTYTQTAAPYLLPGAAAVDSASAALYAEVRPGLQSPQPGGIIDFLKLPDGSFIIPYWRIFVNDTWLPQAQSGVPPKAPVLIKETGGIVLGIGGVRQ